MESKFYRALVPMADEAKKALDEIEKTINSSPIRTEPLHALARACIDGDKLDPSIAKDLGPKRKHNFESAVFFLSANRSYTNAQGQNKNVEAAIHNIKQLALTLAQEVAAKEQDASAVAVSPRHNPVPPYVNETRISDLRNLLVSQRRGTSLDATRLIRLLEELNLVSAAECHMATAMLVRAILDHVPTVFRFQTFAEVANNYSGERSFKGSMAHLQNSLRNIADAHLHLPMRNSEILPTDNQVNFRSDLDVLLGQVIRILQIPS